MKHEDDLATLSLNILPHSKTPIYQQLLKQLRHLIETGRLKSGERLPSSRKLAQWLNISRTSTLTAYEQLIAEGVLVSRPASGTFVTALADAWCTSESQQGKTDALPINVIKAKSSYSGVAFDAGSDVELFPAKAWARCLNRAWRNPDPGCLRDYQAGGYWTLRQAVSSYVKRLRGIDCKAEQVIITAGNRDALALIAECLLSPGAIAAIEEPCYPPVRDGFNHHGIKLNYFPVDDAGMQVPLPSSSVELAWMTPAIQYPLGTSMSIERRLEWLNYSQTQPCWLVEDDYDSEFQYRKIPLLPLYQLQSQLYSAPQAKVIYVGSLSKVMFRTLRIGFMIVPEPLIEAFLAAQIRIGSLASVPIQPALAEFLISRQFVTHLRRMRSCYQQRQKFLFELLKQHFGDNTYCELPDLGMRLLLHLNSHQAGWDQDLERGLKQAGFFAPALSKHYHGAAKQGLLLGFSGTAQSYLEYGVEQLQQLIAGSHKA